MPVYSQNVTTCIKVNGQILRESGDLVTLPFGAEYSVYIRNLNSVRIQATISVDGQLATEDRKLIVEPNSSLELERFIKGGNLNAGNKFRFIARTEEIEKHRGIGSDDGLVRVEAWREIPPVQWYSLYSQAGVSFGVNGPQGGILRGMGMNMTGGAQASVSNASASTGGWQHVNSNKMSRARETERSINSSVIFEQQSLSDVGITVPGSESRQQFIDVVGFPVETQSTVIVLRLRGQVGEVPVVRPVTVKAKPACGSCGKINRAGMQFCGRCGTALVVYA